MAPRCVCGCTRDRHDHFNPFTYCGWCGGATCDRYRNVRVAVFYAIALVGLAFILPFAGGVWVAISIASNAPFVAVILGTICLLVFDVYRNAALRQVAQLRRYRDRRKAEDGSSTGNR